MGRINQLQGTVNNLGDSFLSGPNISFLRKVIPVKIEHFTIDLLHETITPSDLHNETTQKIIFQHKQ